MADGQAWGLANPRACAWHTARYVPPAVRASAPFTFTIVVAWCALAAAACVGEPRRALEVGVLVIVADETTYLRIRELLRPPVQGRAPSEVEVLPLRHAARFEGREHRAVQPSSELQRGSSNLGRSRSPLDSQRVCLMQTRP
jgi:hypothetical protein